ncbi:MAG: DUF4179 domain-containing protein [Blautia sp.]|jgi:hypothetical protein
MNPNIDDKITKLQQNVEIPDIVWEKANEAFSQIKGYPVTEIPSKNFHQKTGKKSSKRSASRSIQVAAAAVAVLLLGTTVFFAANPALASQLPIIGRIFSQVEKNTTFSGDYSSKAQVLEDPNASTDFTSIPEEGFSANDGDSSFAAENAETPTPSAYTISDNQMTVTASEIYCDGLSVYLTFQVEYEGDLGEIPSAYTGGTIDGTTSQYFYTFGTWSVNGEEPIPTENNYLEGTQLDEHTFTGMMRLDLNRFPQVTDVQTLQLNLDRLGADNLEIDSSQLDDIGPMLEVNGNWDFNFPVTVDTSEVHTIEVEDVADNGYGVASVVCSPYQVRVTTLAPEGAEYQPEVAVFNQDGERLQPYEGILNMSTFAVQEKELTTLHIYVGTDEFADLFKAQTMEEASSLCYYETTVEF